MKKVFLSALLAVGMFAVAHEGHETPGALPPAPNGGKLAAAEHSSAHQGKEEAELFLEGKLQGQTLRLYPHGLGPTDMTAFSSLKPGSSLSLTDVKIEMPRSKKTTSPKVIAKADHWELDLSGVTDRRMIVVATVMDKSEKKIAKIQIEK